MTSSKPSDLTARACTAADLGPDSISFATGLRTGPNCSRPT